MPRVSINLCCYNAERFLDDVLRSLVTQTYQDWELVIVNDGSSDATETIIQRYQGEGWPIVYHVQANRGLAEARNQALRLSSGELIAFTDHDDLWMPDKLARQVPRFDADPLVGVVYSDCLNVRDDGYTFRQYEKLHPYTGEAFRPLFRQYFLSVQTVIIHRRVLEDEPAWFDARFEVLPDTEFFLRVARRWRLAFVNEPLAWIRMHQQSTTRARRDRFPVELRLMLQRQRELDPHFDRDYPEEIAQFLFGISRMEARLAWERNQRAHALKLLRPYRGRYRDAVTDTWLISCLSYVDYERLRLRLSRVDWLRQRSMEACRRRLALQQGNGRRGHGHR